MADPPQGMPRWVKGAGLVALAVVLLGVVMLLATGHHGPGRHLGGQEPLATAPAGPAAGGSG
ncbi:hypothetical protein ACQEV2_38030 [Streptomyces sp. CA-251387]|uniref:hypothetical protein n=1 Tax=Streptomyces sp. CA-251387 TaxID=3240064 RepID=UPI003D8F57B4